MFSLDKQQVIGHLKSTASNDGDILAARKGELVAEQKKYKMIGLVPIIAGTCMTLTIIGAIVGIPALILGFWVRSRGNKNIKLIEATYAEYTGTAKPLMRAA
ncbi:hypothetical protein BH10PSE17_BH10PSE17_16840 [soil metagenome]